VARSKSAWVCLLWMVMAFGLGCASAPAVKIDANSTSPALIHNRVQANIERIRTLRGTGTLSMESPEMAGSGSFEIVLRKPDSMLLKLEGPFGIEVGSALVTRDGFLFYNSLQNQLITGSTNAENLRRTLRMSVTFDDLINLFSGAAFLADDNEPDEFAAEDNQYVLTYRRADGTRKYWIDPTTLFIANVQHLDPDGKLVAEQRYTKYRTSADGAFPSSVRFIMNTQRRMLSVHYDTVELNAPALSFALDIPQNAKRVHIE